MLKSRELPSTCNTHSAETPQINGILLLAGLLMLARTSPGIIMWRSGAFSNDDSTLFQDRLHDDSAIFLRFGIFSWSMS